MSIIPSAKISTERLTFFIFPLFIIRSIVIAILLLKVLHVGAITIFVFSNVLKKNILHVTLAFSLG